MFVPLPLNYKYANMSTITYYYLGIIKRKMLMGIISLTFCVFFNINLSKAQELNCSVQINHQQIQSSDKEVFTTMQTAIHEFMNDRRWTNHQYKMFERIDCSILITIQSWPQTEQFTGTIQVQSRRPAFSTSYNSSLFNYFDNNANFTYIESQPLDFSDNSHISNLTSILAFYAYIILGLDYDSYSPQGGTEFFVKAQNIVNNAQTESETGWKAFESQRNRYWLIENLLNQSYSALRDCYYKYHRLGLDVMHDKQQIGRNAITEALEGLQRLKRAQPNVFFFQFFFSAKGDELVNIYSEATDPEKQKVVRILNELDPANSSKYRKIIQK